MGSVLSFWLLRFAAEACHSVTFGVQTVRRSSEGGKLRSGPNHAVNMHGLQGAWTIGGTVIAGQVASPPASRPVVPLGDTSAVVLGTVVCLLVIYAIVAAHLRKEH